MEGGDLEDLLSEQISYYRARAPEYEAGTLDLPGGDEIEDALDSFRPTGDVLELACGPGQWTKRLLRHAQSVTAIDSSAEMLAIASRQVGHDDRVRFVKADLFRWRPDRQYDVVFFGFWLSHVPLERFDAFRSMVAECLTARASLLRRRRVPNTRRIDRGRLVNGDPPAPRGRDRFSRGEGPATASGLERRLTDMGWQIEVRQTSGPFYWGSGSRA